MITKVVKDRKVQPVKSVKEFQDLAGKSDELAVYVQAGEGPGRFVTLSKARRMKRGSPGRAGARRHEPSKKRRGRPGVSRAGPASFIDHPDGPEVRCVRRGGGSRVATGRPGGTTEYRRRRREVRKNRGRRESSRLRPSGDRGVPVRTRCDAKTGTGRRAAARLARYSYQGRRLTASRAEPICPRVGRWVHRPPTAGGLPRRGSVPR